MAQKITFLEREKIFELLNKNYMIREIAQILNRHISSIYRELKRLPGHYSPLASQNDALIKSKNSRKKEKLQNEDLKNYVTSKLKELWSPEQISNRIKIDFPNNEVMRISIETIYKFIYNIKNPYEKRFFIKYLRRRKKYRYNRKNKNLKRNKIPNIKPIHTRPKEIENREDIGHWEGDLIIGKNHQTAIGTLVERSSRYTIIIPLIREKDSYTTVNSFIEAFEKLPSNFIKSLTYDRGTEMTYHEMITKKLGINVYFADPHSPWQRGTNENTNGLIRTFFPKKTDFSKYIELDFIKVQNQLNNRPRKVLSYLTPNEFLKMNNIDL